MAEKSSTSRVLDIDAPSSDATLNICLDTLKLGKQALVFCNTKRGAESQAERVAAKVETKSHELEVLAEEVLHVISSPTKQCKRLATCLKRGIAFHHAGLHAKQRELVENKFREGVIKIICSTPTLAMGLDLPAFRVVIRDLKRFGSDSWGMSDIPVLEYHQMCFPADVQVKTKRGELPISDVSTGEKVLAFDPLKKKYAYRTVKKTYQRRVEMLTEIEAARGIVLRLTGNHPVWIRREESEKWISASTILPGDEVLISSQALTGGKIKVPFLPLLPEDGVYIPRAGSFILELKAKKSWSDREIAAYLKMKKKDIYSYKYDKKALPLKKVRRLAGKIGLSPKELTRRITVAKSRYGTHLLLPRYVDENFLWLAGIIATDGTLTSLKDKRHGSRCVRVRICNTDDRIARRARRILESLTGPVYQHTRVDGLIELEKGCTLLADILRNHFGIPHNAKTRSVQVPPMLMNASPRLIGAYLAGVFDGDGSYKEPGRILFATGSKHFAEQLRQLLMNVGIIPTLARSPGGKIFRLKGKNITFPSESFTVSFHRRSYMRKFARIAPVTKADIITSFSTYHNLHKFHDNGQEYLFVPVKNIRTLDGFTDVFNLQVEKENTFFANGILVHNCGRAGRPGKETYGEAIILAENEDQKDERTERYLLGEPEQILSKLAVEPVLRTYVLSLIASEFVITRKGLYEFFEKTFYAKQYGDTRKLRSILDKMTGLLEEWEFIDVAHGSSPRGLFVSAKELGDGKLRATLLGKRVAELYLDPYTAHFLMTCLRRGTQQGVRDFAVLHMLASCLEMRPWLRPKVREVDDIVAKVAPLIDSLLAPEPVQYSDEYEEFLMTVKTALFLSDWTEEIMEDELLERYGIAPGEVHAKLDKADWLIYAAEELVRLMGFQQLRAPLARLRLRLKHGAKEELLALLQLKNIGRVRARRLFKANIHSIGDVKSAEVSTLATLLGKAVALDIKAQVGEEHDPEKVQVPTGKRKGQRSMGDYDDEKLLRS
jgi:replicative superfamily II helicase/intein/homing endonuclease